MSSAAPAQPSKDSRARRTLFVIGELLITAGVLALLFVAYQLWWTNVQSAQQTSQARVEAQHAISASGAEKPVSIGKAFGLLYIPRLRDHVWATPIVQGVERPQLARGVGHYPKSAMPGQVGNFALAGHRATHGEPFAHFDDLRDGDKVYVETKQGFFTYVLVRDQIVQPTDLWVINPQPFPTDPLPNDRIITLTTCNPRWASYERWAYWGVLTEVRPLSAGPPAEVSS